MFAIISGLLFNDPFGTIGMITKIISGVGAQGLAGFISLAIIILNSGSLPSFNKFSTVDNSSINFKFSIIIIIQYTKNSIMSSKKGKKIEIKSLVFQ